MSNKFLYGKPVKEEILKRITEELKRIGRVPKLIIIQIGDNAASNIYVGNKLKSALACGINAEVRKYPIGITEEELCKVIKALNNDDTIHGIIVQLPLPKHINEVVIANLIDTAKDVDGFNNESQGGVMTNSVLTHRPCTPKGIISLLTYYNESLVGKNVVIVGRSNIVGKPLAMMMTNMGATVTVCHTQTLDIKHKTKLADIVVLATGQLKHFNSEYFSHNQLIIDVGIGRDGNGKLCGDLDLEEVTSALDGLRIVPSPGGCGQTTVASLMENTLNAMNL